MAIINAVAADIRYGTTVGAIVGTCHVPEAHEVLFNVPVDNTVGSLVPVANAPAQSVDLTTLNNELDELATLLNEVKGKTDSLTFTTGVKASSILP